MRNTTEKMNSFKKNPLSNMIGFEPNSFLVLHCTGAFYMIGVRFLFESQRHHFEFK